MSSTTQAATAQPSASTSKKGGKKAGKTDAVDKINAGRRKYEYPPEGYVDPPGDLRIHTSEEINGYNRGRVIQQWSFCVKPRSEPNAGCRSGWWGYYVWWNGVLRKAIVLLRPECNFVEEESDESDKEDANDADAEELGGGEEITT